jgi:hypothetical protein
MAYKRPLITMKRIMSLSFFVAVFSLCAISCGGGTSSSSSEGYGEYHNVNTGERQSSYKGSVEQQEDIATLDKMIDEGY